MKDDYTDPREFAAAIRRAQRAARKRRPPAVRTASETRRLPRRLSERTGLSGLLKRGWAVWMDAGGRWRLTRGAAHTGRCARREEAL